jgi:hypothetical protein
LAAHNCGWRCPPQPPCAPDLGGPGKTSNRPLGELFLCRHCAMRLWPALAAQGWTLWLIGEPKFATSAR